MENNAFSGKQENKAFENQFPLEPASMIYRKEKKKKNTKHKTKQKHKQTNK